MVEIQIQEFTVQVDDEDVKRIQERTWYVNRTQLKNHGMHYFYNDRVINKKKHTITLHRYIMGCTIGDNKIVDHIDHNGLNLTKTNLRFCTPRENIYNQRKNQANTSGYKGVEWNNAAKKWQARITSDSVAYYLGLFKDPIEAAKAYDKACLYFHKEFGCTNFPIENYFGCDLKKEVAILLDREMSSKYVGVNFHKNGWASHISKDKVRYHLGLYKTEDEAGKAYDIAVDILFNGAKPKNLPEATYTDKEIDLVKRRIAGERLIHANPNKKSRYMYIYQQKNGKWTADVCKHNNGTYQTEEEAAYHADIKSWELFHDVKRLNFPERIAEYTLTTSS